MFADNFDYQDLRQDFIRGVLTDDILGNKIFAHVISGEYAGRVKCLRTYNAVRYLFSFGGKKNFYIFFIFFLCFFYNFFYIFLYFFCFLIIF